VGYSYDYVCEPRRITLTASKAPRSSAGIDVFLYVDGREAYSFFSSLDTFTPTEKDIDDHVERFCNLFKKLTEDQIQEKCDEDKMMLVLYIHRFLNKVESRSGRTIWKL
jgi:hypothetical protein